MAANDLQCIFYQATSCPAGTVRLLGVRNDTGGYINAHVQNNSVATYDYSLCCNNTNESITITTGCPGNATVINLSNITNALVDVSGSAIYDVSACLSSSWKSVSCAYPTASCAADYACIMSIAGSEGSNITNAHIGECDAYEQKVCCALVNSPPTKPVLTYPANMNDSVDERRPNFQWQASSDPEGDSIYYVLNINCINCSVSCYQPTISGIDNTTRQLTSPLCIDEFYNWSVTACDKYDECNDSISFNFTIPSVANLEVIMNSSFGSMSPGSNDDTTDDSPSPIVIRNTGNVRLNVTVNGTALFSSVAMNTEYYQFMGAENETGSYTAGCSQTSFTNMDTAAADIFCYLLYEENTDEADIEINVTVPLAETPGAKSSTVEIGYLSAD